MNPAKALQDPRSMFFVGIVYSSLAVGASLLIFPEYAGLLMVFLTVMGTIPFMYAAIRKEEKKDLANIEEKALLKEHARTLSYLTIMFLGFVLSFTVWYLILPDGVSVHLFQIQAETIERVNDPIAGNAYNLAGEFFGILVNNLKVMLFCLLFAFIYGFGAIFILTWNASIIAVAIGSVIRASSDNLAVALPAIMLRYFIHGIPEILAFFMAGLAGGIIAIATIRHDLRTKKAAHVLIDSLDLIAGSILLLVMAAALEVFVSPLMG